MRDMLTSMDLRDLGFVAMGLERNHCLDILSSRITNHLPIFPTPVVPSDGKTFLVPI